MGMDWLFQYADPSIDWNYAMVTLVVRFIGVFVVMIVMMIALQASAKVVRRIERRRLAASADTPTASPPESGPDPAPLDDATVAAIGLALALDAAPHSQTRDPGGPSAWAITGRLQQLTRRPRG